jgi:hypothetical protein
MTENAKNVKGSVIKTKASKELEIQAEEELKQEDPAKTLGKRILEKLGKEALDD